MRHPKGFIPLEVSRPTTAVATPTEVGGRLLTGFTLIEVLVVSAIIIILGGVIYATMRDLFFANSFFSDALLTERTAESAISTMISELRGATQGDTGTYALEKTDPNSLAWYANIDNDSQIERVQYFVNQGSLWKSVVNPAGNPLTYSTSTVPENVTLVLRGIVASTTVPTFSYYPATYAGTSTPLAQPFSPVLVRHVKITLIIDNDPTKLPPPLTVSSEVNLRNLKDNY